MTVKEFIETIPYDSEQPLLFNIGTNKYTLDELLTDSIVIEQVIKHIRFKGHLNNLETGDIVQLGMSGDILEHSGDTVELLLPSTSHYYLIEIQITI